jgi:hypothetical protein
MILACTGGKKLKQLRVDVESPLLRSKAACDRYAHPAQGDIIGTVQPGQEVRVLDDHYTKEAWCLHVEQADGSRGYLVWKRELGQLHP